MMKRVLQRFLFFPIFFGMRRVLLGLSFFLISFISLAQAYAPVESHSQEDMVQEEPRQQEQSREPLVPAQEQVERDPASEQQSLNFMNRIDELQNQLQSLRGQMEDQQHQIEQLKSSKAVASSPEGEKPSATTPNTPAVSQADVLNQQHLYQKAYDAISQRRYSEGKTELQMYLQQYPQGEYAVNAHYWLGEINLMGGDLGESEKEFKTVLQDYPHSPKAIDASLKLGFMAYDGEAWAQAKQYFQQVLTQAPNTAAAQLAEQRLQEMKQTGHG